MGRSFVCCIYIIYTNNMNYSFLLLKNISCCIFTFSLITMNCYQKHRGIKSNDVEKTKGATLTILASDIVETSAIGLGNTEPIRNFFFSFVDNSCGEKFNILFISLYIQFRQ